MNTKLKESVYKGLSSVVIENDILRAEFLPVYGSKMVSLQDLRKGREFLFQRETDKLKKPPHGADFSQYDASGFDEMFPTIDASFYPEGSLQGLKLADHGEVWTESWQCSLDKSEKTLDFAVELPRLKCRLHKKIELDENKIILDYGVHNNNDEPLIFLWAAHPLFKYEQDMELMLPREVEKVINVEDKNLYLGRWGERHGYPFTISRLTGEELDLRSMDPSLPDSCQKFYTAGELTEGFCGVSYPETGARLEMYFPPEQVPYLGIWKSLGELKGDYNLALEPCTGAFDDLYLAHKTGRAAEVKPGSDYEWWLEMRIFA
ncbi:hypothetical protein [Halarsenatibacter silvermanii]|uniref:Galactose mutarotase n=1 Tax=Halarsenatibacter silvermanii TaxID=321763 RepID=A0A1G9GTU7_9FIRM|nr:hypothetical protein [Halarsenatibacter silvermanii]SDL04140.1 Galactose mutarotase [Halarsenatibacter silvermanii]